MTHVHILHIFCFKKMKGFPQNLGEMFLDKPDHELVFWSMREKGP